MNEIPKANRPRWTNWTKILASAGVVIAVANLILAWLTMWHVRPTSATSIPAPTSAIQAEVFDATDYIAASMVGYQHTVNIVGATFAFALLGIGFSLFVIGVENTFNLKAEGGGLGKLTLASISPGIACIIAAATLVGITLLRQPTLTKQPEGNREDVTEPYELKPHKQDISPLGPPD